MLPFAAFCRAAVEILSRNARGEREAILSALWQITLFHHRKRWQCRVSVSNNHLFATIPAHIVGMKTAKDLHTRTCDRPTKIVSKKLVYHTPGGGWSTAARKNWWKPLMSRAKTRATLFWGPNDGRCGAAQKLIALWFETSSERVSETESRARASSKYVQDWWFAAPYNFVNNTRPNTQHQR